MTKDEAQKQIKNILRELEHSTNRRVLEVEIEQINRTQLRDDEPNVLRWVSITLAQPPQSEWGTA